ncbi:MAG TPA: hypothetical protein PLT48_15820, partial [Nitrospira sp.]|nr:hypothetical protein [Nitrospira sp.]
MDHFNPLICRAQETDMENNGCSAGPLDVVVRLRALDREGYQPLTGAIGEEAAAEIERLRQDTKRLDFLDWLMTRTEFQNRERPNVPVKSDMHLTDWGCALYARNLVGRIVGTGNGKTVREAIDVMRAANDLERATGVGGAVAETIQEQCNAIAREAGSDLRFGIGGAHEVTTNADVTGLPPVGHPLHELGKHLAQYLDDDRFNECERLLLEGWDHDKIDRKTGQHWRENSSLEVWFPFSAEELERLRETLQGIADADWRNWKELADPNEFVRWAQARARHALTPN